VLDALRVAVRRRMVSDVPGGDPAVGRARLLADRRAAGRAGAARAGDVLGRLPRRRRPGGRRVRVLRPGGAPSSAPTTTRSGSGRSGCCRRCRGRSRR
jgi:hypothetical protein